MIDHVDLLLHWTSGQVAALPGEKRAGLDVALHKEEVVPIMTLLLDNLLFLQLLGGMRPSWQPCRHP